MRTRTCHLYVDRCKGTPKRAVPSTNSQKGYLDDARLGDLDLALGLAAAAALSLNGLDDIHAVNDLAEHDVLAIELRLVWFSRKNQRTQLVTTVVMNCTCVSRMPQRKEYVRTASRWCWGQRWPWRAGQACCA